MSLGVRVGIHLLFLAEFERAWKQGGVEFEQRLFHPSELADRRLALLAGTFSIKEAAAKALDLPPGSWLALQVAFDPAGRPRLEIADSHSSGIVSCDVSVTHTSTHVSAACVILLQKNTQDSEPESAR